MTILNRSKDRTRTVTAILLSLTLTSSLFAAQEKADEKTNGKPDEKSNVEKLAARRLEFMKTSVKDYVFVLGPDFQSTLSIEPEPLLRFTNPVSGLQDGGFFVWKSDAGRPMVGAQVFLTSDDLWIHEFQSLAPMPFKVTRSDKTIWEPKRAGVDVKPIPDAPVPAAGAVQRLVQMRDIARRFTASDEFEGRPKSDELRLLTKPLLRFGAENSGLLDGALFVHAHGTDPELMIVLEALKSEGGYRWHYSLAPMTGYALKASLDDKPVWEVAWRKPPFDSKEPFFILVHSRELSLRNVFK